MAVELAARKFNRAKWTVTFSIKDSDAPADAITVCLRTTDNRLSFWNCTKADDSIKDVVLALATGSRVERLDKMHVIGMSKRQLASKGLSFLSNEGDTAVQELRGQHFDVVELTLSRLSKIARLMSRNIRKDILCYTYTRKDVAQIINKAITDGRLIVDNLHPSLQTELAGFIDH